MLRGAGNDEFVEANGRRYPQRRSWKSTRPVWTRKQKGIYGTKFEWFLYGSSIV